MWWLGALTGLAIVVGSRLIIFSLAIFGIEDKDGRELREIVRYQKLLLQEDIQRMHQQQLVRQHPNLPPAAHPN